MWDYTDTVKEHFLNPKNVGQLPDANGIGETGSLACGDALRLYIKVENERIVDATFQTFGCGSAIASSSVLTEMVKGKTLDEALLITNKEIAETLGGLPKEKMHCSVMGREALEAAINDYRGIETPKQELEGEVVCECFGVTDVQIRRTVEENNLTTLEDVTHYTKAGGGCERCHPEIEEILAEVRGVLEAKREEKPAAPKKLTNMQRIQLVQKVIDEEIRPSLQADGGDLELVDVDGTEVYVSLRGTCTHCPSSQITLKEGVEGRLKEIVDANIRVVEV
ncbi:MAG TPA: Fe-S cluster assembly protein NifU [Deferrisomatales bacterium]|nr:Fe-S cluster assembly protein NifU [Deferrisomatales bacterium]